LWRIWFRWMRHPNMSPHIYVVLDGACGLGALGGGLSRCERVAPRGECVVVVAVVAETGVARAWLAAALFALHPVQVESVAWISERKNVLSLFFMLLSASAWADFIELPQPAAKQSYRRALVFHVLALASKATACLLPAALVCLLWLKGKRLDRRRILQLIPFVVLGSPWV